jgi:hypothetical protein
MNGWANISLQPTSLLPLARGATLSLFVRARKPGESLWPGVSTRMLFAVGLGPATPASGVAGSLYQMGARGYDLSFPDCERPRPPDGAFAILGLNGGHPFSFNPCLRREYGWYAATTPRAFYVNTAYIPSYGTNIILACAQAAAGLDLTMPQTRAYAIGCSEAATSVQHLGALGLPQPAVWWLNVETANRWSSARQLNVMTLRGLIDYLNSLTPRPAVGVYSSRRDWIEITGGWSIAAPEWIPKGYEAAGCPAPFSSGSVWLSQGGGSSLDQDRVC